METVRNAIHQLTLAVAMARNRADEEEERKAKVKRAIASNGYEAVSDADMRRYAPESKGLDLVDASVKPLVNLPTAEAVEALREAVDTLASWHETGNAAFNDMADNINALRLRHERLEGEVATLRTEIASLKAAAAPPPEPSQSEVLGRALRW